MEFKRTAEAGNAWPSGRQGAGGFALEMEHSSCSAAAPEPPPALRGEPGGKRIRYIAS